MRNSYFAILVLLMACAQVRPPSGGPKDEVPPAILATDPPNYSLHFQEREITIQFDELVRLNNINDQLIVSPRLEEDPDVSIKRGSVLQLKLPDSLSANTTYTLNFGNSVEDITEGNKALDLNYVFSTGPYLDSMIVFGALTNAYTSLPEENALIMLYDSASDPNPRVDPPLYFTRTNELGFFQLHHLRNTAYFIFALEDLNFNYLYDLPNERLAFLQGTIQPQVADSNAMPTLMRMFQEKPTEQFIAKYEIGPLGKVMLELALPTDSLRLEGLPANAYRTEISLNSDTCIYWMTDTAGLDGVELRFFDGVLALDTISIERPPTDAKNVRLLVRNNIRGDFGPTQRLILEANRPIEQWKHEQMQLLADSDTVAFQIVPLDNIHRHFLVDFERGQALRHTFSMLPGAFKDIYGMVVDSTTIRLGTEEPDHYGVVVLAFEHKSVEETLILQLENERGGLVAENIAHDGLELRYEHLPPGKYKLRCIYDSNGNGQWDTGKYEKGTLPETVIYYSDEIIVRSGWEMELRWSVR